MSFSQTAAAAASLVRAQPWLGAAALLLLCLTVYLPGVLRLPAVDRTEIVFAETTRQMVETGAWLDPRYGEVAHAFRPPGTYWAQGAALKLAGPHHARDIRIFRIPGVLAVTLAVLALYCLAVPLTGAPVALMGAALFAVAPLTVAVAQLAIAEGLSLLPATVAMLALLRIYVHAEDEAADPAGAEAQTRGLALLFWAAIGVGMLVNALLVPILAGVATLALVVSDRDAAWLKRTKPALGVPVALAIALPWFIVRVLQDGVPLAHLPWSEFLAALGGSQDMKLRAMPGSFLLAAVLGFLPGAALAVPAVVQLWRERLGRLDRFLLAWIASYLVYLELLSSKPGTYMVQTVFPALALAVARFAVVADNQPRRPGHVPAWPWLAALFAAMPFAAIYGFAAVLPSAPALLAIAAVMALFAVSADAARRSAMVLWAGSGIAALGLFAVTLLALVLPAIPQIWPARDLAAATVNCKTEPMNLIGFREPSGRFVLGAPYSQQTPATAAALLGQKAPRLTVVEDRWHGRFSAAVAAAGQGPLPPPSACISAYNIMRGCALQFRIYESGEGTRCAFPPQFSCSAAPPLPAAPVSAAPDPKSCD